MRIRMINTNVASDSWFVSLPIDEQRFFLQLLITPHSEMSGVFFYPDREMLFDMPFFNQDRLTLMKKRFESDNKVFFFDGWIWMVNWSKNNYFKSISQLGGIFKQMSDVQRRNKNVFDYFVSKGLTMNSFQDYILAKQRAKLKKDLHYKNPYLMGQALDREVDKLIGAVKSDKFDFLRQAASIDLTPSKYPTPESAIPHIEEVARQYNVKQWALWWLYQKKISKLGAVGRDKHDYLELLKQVAMTPKKLSNEEKILALQFYAKDIQSQVMSRDEAITLIERHKL